MTSLLEFGDLEKITRRMHERVMHNFGILYNDDENDENMMVFCEQQNDS